MNKLQLPHVTLLGMDCVNVERLQAALDISQKDIEFGAVKLFSSLSTDDSRLVSIPHIGSIEGVSMFLIRDLHKYVDTEYVLLVQYDGFVLNVDSWDPAFLNYDYIGAPWNVGSWETDLFPEDMKGKLVVGNGGFCFRSKKFIEVSAKLADKGKITRFHPEDVALCVWYRDLMEKEGITFAPPELAAKFSIESDIGVYDKPFGFHGLYGKNIDMLIAQQPDFPRHLFLSKIRSKRLQQIQKVFEPTAIEGHIFGSIARGSTDEFSDIDIWLIFNDEDMKGILEKRFEYYAKVGDIVHIVEAPQNSPVGGVQSAVLYKTKVGLLIVDYSLCPLSTAFTTKESKKLFGNIDLPLGEAGFNQQKVTVSDVYRIDFFIGFIFNGIKKIVRKDDDGFSNLMKEYQYLAERYGIAVKPLTQTSNTFATLEEVLENTKEVANEKQLNVLNEISNFLTQVKMSDTIK